MMAALLPFPTCLTGMSRLDLLSLLPDRDAIHRIDKSQHDLC